MVIKASYDALMNTQLPYRNNRFVPFT